MEKQISEPEVSVAILSDDEIDLVLYGNYFASDGKTILNGKYKAFIRNDVIVLKSDEEEFEIESGTLFVPQDFESDSFVLRDVIIGKRFHWEKKENQRQ